MFVSVDTDCRGVVCLLAGLAAVNIIDCLSRPELADEVLSRFKHPRGCEYRRESPDEWSTVAAQFRRVGRFDPANAAPWRFDCEDLAAFGATAAVLLCLRRPDMRARIEPIEVCVTQPGGRGMAHAYTRIANAVRDQSVRYGMREPRGGAAWYDQGQTAAIRVTVPEFSIWRE